MYDVTALGELLIDFTPHGTSERGNFIFEANPGGAPCNVLAQLSRLGKNTAFIGKVGDDAFGRFLKSTIEKENINSDSLVITPDYFTTLAFVTLSADGNRDFSFARKPGADTMLSPDEVDENQINNSRIFHLGTLSLTHENAKQSTIKALKIAKENGVLVSCDPNLRLSLWQDENSAKEAIELVLSYADIIKISDYEIEFLCGNNDIKAGAKMLYKKYSPKIMFVTCGADGAFLIKDDLLVSHPGFTAKAVDTTGAGDSFCGAALNKLLDFDLNFEKIGENQCFEILAFANAAASICVESFGAISVMPDASAVLNRIK